jgi:hypothetical protein
VLQEPRPCSCLSSCLASVVDVRSVKRSLCQYVLVSCGVLRAAAASKVMKGDRRNTTFTNNIRFAHPRSILSHIFCTDHRTHRFVIVVDLDSTYPPKSSVTPVHSPCKKRGKDTLILWEWSDRTQVAGRKRFFGVCQNIRGSLSAQNLCTDCPFHTFF